MGTKFKKWLVALLGISVLPAIAEFSVKLAEQKGVYDDPEGYLMMALQGLIGSSWYLPTVFLLFGLFVGAFANHLLTIKEPDENLLKPDGAKDIEFESFDLENQFEVVTGRHFANEKITVDGKKFVRCEFRNVTLEFNATKPFSMDSCEFFGFHLSTRNRYAERMIGILVALGWLKFPARDNGKLVEVQANYHDLNEERLDGEKSQRSPRKG